MAIKANPNRMELLKLKKRTKMAKRGHRLLKYKLDELIFKFLKMVEEQKKLRREIENELNQSYRFMTLTRAEASLEMIEEAFILPRTTADIKMKSNRIIGVIVPEYEINFAETNGGYSLSSTPAVLDQAVSKTKKVLERLVRLAELEKSIELMAVEIEKTRRRVNALEHVLIPQLNALIGFITMKLDEFERSNLVRLMKIKQMVSEEL